MNRRSVLSVVGVAIGGGLSGCASVNGGDDPPEFERTSIRALDRACTDDVDDAATISFGESGTRVDVAGHYGVRDISSKLQVRTRRDNTDERNVILRVDHFADASANEAVSDCAGSIDYKARVSLSRAPTEVIVQHTNEELGDHESRAWPETVATSSP